MDIRRFQASRHAESRSARAAIACAGLSIEGPRDQVIRLPVTLSRPLEPRASVTQFALSDVAVEFGGAPVFEHVTFQIGRGERWGVVGRNGSGKTTLFNLIAGRIRPSRGSVTRPASLRVTMLDQHREFPGSETVWDAAVAPFSELMALERNLACQAEALADAGEHARPDALARYDRDLERFSREGGYEFEARSEAVLQGLGFDPAEARTRPLARLSGGEAGRLSLARQLTAAGDLLLLDEPTNHLDLDTTRWLEEYLAAVDLTAMVVSHDRAFLEATVNHTLHLERGTATSYRGTYGSFVHQRAERMRAEVGAAERQRRLVAKEEDFIRRNIAGQKTRQAQSRRKKLERLPRLGLPPSEDGTMGLRLEPARRGGNQVVVIASVRLEVRGRALLEDFSGSIERGDVIGLVGPNGAGKTTLLDTIADERLPGRGTIRLGASIDPAYYRQSMSQVPRGKPLFDIVSDLRPEWDRGQVQGHLGRFGFSGDSVKRRAETLSGGEQARVALAMLTLTRANFLILDEPTNHLDVESVEVLEDALAAFDGTVLLVSHDRALLRALATRVWSLEAGRLEDYPGSFLDWEKARRERAEHDVQQAKAATDARRERNRDNARRRHSRLRAARRSLRALREEAAAAETEVHHLEGLLAELQDALADPTLYESPDGLRASLALKSEMAAVDAALESAVQRWTEAGEALEEAGG